MHQHRLTDQIRPRPIAVPSTLLIVVLMLASAASVSEAVLADASQRVQNRANERSAVRNWSSSLVRAVRCLVSGHIQSEQAQSVSATALARSERGPNFPDRAGPGAVITRLLRSRSIDLPPPAVRA